MKKFSYAPYFEFFSVLANELRLSIILALKRKKMSVKQLSSFLSEEQSLVSHALQELKQCKLVEFKKEGKNNIYSLSKSARRILIDTKLFELLEKHFCKTCGKKCARLALKKARSTAR
ncbi:MAG: winged helix-turn-helix transcriptional regulator [Candidatus Diapherotrites archaeon]|nr:winged helix-turn-helix transcriptional regulator [Candidatus Diapherotrites archaeon]